MKKGFTLIELLAVIIILAIIALFATPMILNVIEDAKQSAGLSEANMILKGVENYCEQEKIRNNPNEKICNNNFSIDDIKKIVNLKSSEILEVSYENEKLNWLLIKSNGHKFGLVDGIMVMETVDNPLGLYRDKSGANGPELLGLVPIKYDGKKWIYADLNEEWYDYDKRQWANAVLLNKEKKVGEEIKEDDIDLWYVWIPRYKYQLFDSSIKNQQINIEFERNIKTTGEVKCQDKTFGKQNASIITSEICNNDITGNWYTHPAFTLNGKELKGIWVGKFEISSNNNRINMKPNQLSLRYKQISQYKEMLDKINENYKIEADNHVIKNMEWGSVAYLSQSKYGLCNRSVCNNIRRNNNSDFKTGYGAATSDENITGNTKEATQLYNTIEGVKASTTHNIYGIYDMSGGTWEYTMGNIVNSENNFYAHNSGITNLTGYYDSYSYDVSSSTYSRGKLGDATKETKGWYNDFEYFPNNSYSWATRGGNYKDGVRTGLNAMDADDGGSDNDVTTRGVLTSKK